MVFKLYQLEDLALQEVFKRLNLNERAPLRLVCGRFKNLIDGLPLDNLIIFDRLPPVISTYKFTNARWNYENTVYVYNFHKFIKAFGHKLERTKRLVIKSVNKFEYDFNIDLKCLTHLELYDITFKSSKIFSSPKLESLLLHEVFIDGQWSEFKVNRLKNCSMSSTLFYPISLSIKEFGYLHFEEIMYMWNVDSMTGCKINHLRVNTTLKIAQRAMDYFKTMKVLELCLVGFSDQDELAEFTELKSGLFLNKKRDDCDLYVYGIKYTQENLKAFNEFVLFARGVISFVFRRACLNVNQCPVVNHLHLNDHTIKRSGSKFYNLIEVLQFEKHLHFVDELENLINVRDLILNLTIESAPYGFHEFLKYFRLINRLEITQLATTHLSNKFLDDIVICDQIYHLKLYCFDPMNFDFLFKLKKLKYLMLSLYYPMKNSIIIKLIKNLKYLSFFQVQFQRPAENYTKDHLSAFKRTVNTLIETEFKIKDAKFMVTIHTQKINKSDAQVIRFTLERSKYIGRRFENDGSDDLKSVFDSINVKGIVKHRTNFLNDDCVLEILKLLNLNDKTSCRLVSHQFCRLVDGLPMHELAIFDRQPILPAKMLFNNQQYSLNDTVLIHEINRFFNPYIIKQLSNIQKLVIYGLNDGYNKSFDLNTKFDKLIHLELHNILITDSIVLKSPNLKKLAIENSSLSNNNSNYYDIIGFKNLRSKLNHFISLDAFVGDLEFYKKCSRSGVFSQLETLNCVLIEFDTLVYISNTFKNLKTVNVRFAIRHRDELIDLFDNKSLGKMVNKLRPDLNVFFFGIPLNKSNWKVIEDFFYTYNDELGFGANTIVLTIKSEWLKFKKTFERKHKNLFDGFFKLVSAVHFREQIEDKTVLNKLTNLNAAFYTFWLEYRYDLPKTFKTHPNINSLQLNSFPDGHYFNDILDKIPVYLKNLTFISIENWENLGLVNFNFLLELKNIKTVRVLTRFLFDKKLFIDMIRKLKYMSCCEVYFEKTDAITKDQLSEYKQSINECIFNEVRYYDALIKIELHHRTSYFGERKYSFVRCIYKRRMRDLAFNTQDAKEHDIMRMMSCIGYKRDNKDSSPEIDTSERLHKRFSRPSNESK